MPIYVFHPLTKQPYLKNGNTVFALVEPNEPGEHYRTFFDNVLYDMVEVFKSNAETEKDLVSEVMDYTAKLEHICFCNKCGNRLIEGDPDLDTPKIMPDGTEINMIQIEDQNGEFWGCPVCVTDAHLKDIKK
jgi:hypothetical protein